MTQRRKISIRKILQVFVTFVATAGCIVAMVSASDIEDSKKVKSVAVHIKNDKKYHFIEEQEILDLAIHNRHVNLAATPLSALDIKSIERVISSDPWVASAQVFVDNGNVLQLYITQRIPVTRLFQQDGRSYYMDTTLSIMPLSRSYIYYTSVVTNVPEVRNDSEGWALRKEIVSLVRAIQADSFWNAQVSQIIVDSAGMYELVPMFGDHRILFGGVDNMKDKFSNLFAFYKNVLNRIGWDKYETLDVRFSGQVVASPSLPYKGPVDKAVSGMNWITSIVETEARNDSMHNLVVAGSHTAEVNKEDKPRQQAKPPVQVKQAVHPVVAAAKKEAKKSEVKKSDKKSGSQKDSRKKEAESKKQATKAGSDKNKNKDKQTNKQQKPKYQYQESKDHH